MPFTIKPDGIPPAGEVLPVPPEMISQVWKHVPRFFRSIPEYDISQLHTRLLLGRDRLWVVVQTAGVHINRPYLGAIVTSVSDRPPDARFDPTKRSLIVHLAGGESIQCWIQNAVERITAYGKVQRCRQLFLLAQKRWRKHALRFFSRDWDTVAISRDRPSEAKCTKPGTKLRNRVGFYRPVIPVREMESKLYASGTYCYLKEQV